VGIALEQPRERGRAREANGVVGALAETVEDDEDDEDDRSRSRVLSGGRHCAPTIVSGSQRGIARGKA
jgi:hypothetical protein